MAKRRVVVITGMGTVNPLGNSVAETWQNMKDGKSGIGKLTRFNPAELGGRENFPVIAGEIKNFDLTQLVSFEDLQRVGLSQNFIRSTAEFIKGTGIGKGQIRKMPLVLQYGVAAVIEALKDAELDLSKEEEAGRRGVVIGSGIGGVQELEKGVEALIKKGLAKIPTRTILDILNNMPGTRVAFFTGSEGRSDGGGSTACATGNHAILIGAEYIKNNQADIVIVGAVEAAITPFGMGAFEQIRTLSHKTEPEKASRPFDRNRDGFVMSEGAGILILEELSRAEKRGARIYGKVAGWASNTDAFHETRGNPVIQKKCMEMALKMAGIKLSKIERLYINAHGTGTIGESIEIKATKLLLGKHIEKAIMVSNKGQLGHCLGAGAVIETIIALKEMEEGIILPNYNLDEVDPECLGVYLPTEQINIPFDFFLKNAFAFGGQNGCTVIKKHEKFNK